jgi:transcriptional regulator with XRE-family HTH domain
MPHSAKYHNDLNIAIGANLRALREFHGETQMALASLLGITFQQLQKYERGQNRLSAERLHCLRQHFKVPYDYFFHGVDETPLSEMDILKCDRTVLEAFRLIYNYKNVENRKKIIEIIRILTN